jgi:hypothetical protein
MTDSGTEHESGSARYDPLLPRSVRKYLVRADETTTVTGLVGVPQYVRAVSDRDVEFYAEHYPHPGKGLARFRVYVTGEELPQGAVYCGSCEYVTGGDFGGATVFHLYDVTGVVEL